MVKNGFKPSYNVFIMLYAIYIFAVVAEKLTFLYDILHFCKPNRYAFHNYYGCIDELYCKSVVFFDREKHCTRNGWKYIFRNLKWQMIIYYYLCN